MNAQPDQATLRDLLDQDKARIRKLQIIFGQWWQHYAVPYELRWTLWAERSLCPYCSGPLGAPPIDANTGDTDFPAHLDHMDPLSRGGEESIRNVVYACARCNLAKGKRLFVDWCLYVIRRFELERVDGNADFCFRRPRIDEFTRLERWHVQVLHLRTENLADGGELAGLADRLAPILSHLPMPSVATERLGR